MQCPVRTARRNSQKDTSAHALHARAPIQSPYTHTHTRPTPCTLTPPTTSHAHQFKVDLCDPHPMPHPRVAASLADGPCPCWRPLPRCQYRRVTHARASRASSRGDTTGPPAGLRAASIGPAGTRSAWCVLARGRAAAAGSTDCARPGPCARAAAQPLHTSAGRAPGRPGR